MSKYFYDVVEVGDESVFHSLNIGDKFRGGVMADGLGGLNGEMLVIIAYEIVEDEDD